METEEDVSTLQNEKVNLSDLQLLGVRGCIPTFPSTSDPCYHQCWYHTDISYSISVAQFLHDTLIDISRKPDNIND